MINIFTQKIWQTHEKPISHINLLKREKRKKRISIIILGRTLLSSTFCPKNNAKNQLIFVSVFDCDCFFRSLISHTIMQGCPAWTVDRGPYCIFLPPNQASGFFFSIFFLFGTITAKQVAKKIQ